MHWQIGMVEIKGGEMLWFCFSKNLVEKVAEKLHEVYQHLKKKKNYVFLHIQLDNVLPLMNQGEMQMLSNI